MFKGFRLVDSFLQRLSPLLRRHLARALAIREKFRLNENTVHLILAGVVGVIGGLVNVIFFGLVEWVIMLLLGRSGDLVEVARILPPWQRVVIPIGGGLAAGLVLYWGLRLVGNQGASNLLEVVVSGNGRLPMRTALVKGFSSLISIGSGASIGREGAITQLTATLASKVGVLAKWPPYRLRLLVASGAAAGLAAAYNAPIAGAIFAAHIVLGSFSMNLFGPLIVASVSATMTSRYFFGIEPFYSIPEYDFTLFSQLPWFIVLGIASGLMAPGFLVLLRKSEDLFAGLQIPIYLRLPLGGLVVGILSIGFPAVWGNGYAAIDQILHEPIRPAALLALFFLKLIAILASVGSGAVGGVFTPTLFLGAALGGLFGSMLHLLGWSALPTGAFAIVGMGSVLAGTIHAPLLAMILIFEISLNYSIMPPLMLACAVSTLLARSLRAESIYTEPLRRKGILAQQELERLGEATQTFVGEIMREPVPPIREITPFQQIADRFLTSAYNFIPVVDENGRLLGVVALHDMKEYLHTEHHLEAIIAADIMRPPPPCVTPNQKLVDAFPVLLTSELRNVPVVNNSAENRLVGSIHRSEALNLLSEALAARGAA